MIIACDVDGVLCDFVGGLGLREEEITEYDISKCVGADRWEKCRIMIHTPGWCRALPPYDGAREAVEAMRRLGRVVFATAPADSATWAGEREDWLAAEMGARPRDVISLRDKPLVNADVLIEDSNDTIHEWIIYTGNPAVRVMRPWNRQGEGIPANVQKLPDVIHLLRRLGGVR